MSLSESNKIHLPGLPIFIFHPLSSLTKRLHLFGLLNYTTSTFVSNLCKSVHESNPHHDPEPVFMLHIFLNGLTYHAPTELEIFYPYVASTDLPEPLQSKHRRITESPSSEKTSKVIQSNHPPTISISPLNHVP